jgi:hypothetical protein
VRELVLVAGGIKVAIVKIPQAGIWDLAACFVPPFLPRFLPETEGHNAFEDFSVIDQVLMSKLGRFGASRSRPETRVEIDEVVTDLASAVLVLHHVECVTLPHIIIIEPGGENHERTNLPAVFMIDRVVRVLSSSSLKFHRAQDLSLKDFASRSPVSALRGLGNKKEKFLKPLGR